MEIKWTKELPSDKPWEAEYHGVFFQAKDNISFCYRDFRDLIYIGEPDLSVTKLTGCDFGLTLPAEWIITEVKNKRFLLCGKDKAFELTPVPVQCAYDSELKNAYRSQYISPIHYSIDSYTFGNYVIEHSGEWGYLCKEGNQTLWKFSGRGYLYTDIYRVGNNIFFGTAGQGGYFYILDIRTGIPILSLKTGGTTQIEQNGYHCYILTRFPKTSLLCIDLLTGDIVDSQELPGTANDYGRLRFHGGQIYAVTFQYKKGRLQNALMTCVYID